MAQVQISLGSATVVIEDEDRSAKRLARLATQVLVQVVETMTVPVDDEED